MKTPQTPIGTGYDAFSTAEQVIGDIDLSGQTAIVTGGYSGLGLETARVLADAGAHVVIPARSLDRAALATRTVRGAEIERLDLMDPGSIDAFADRFLASGRNLSILVDSAGVMATPLSRDGRGHESQFSTNHLGHFQLVLRLWPALKNASGARVVSVSSGGHKISGIDFDDIDFERKPYDKWVAYGQSKTANALFAVALDERGKKDGIRAFSLHPGTVLGPLARHLADDEIAAFGVHDADGRVVVDPTRDLKSVSQGAATSVWCATSKQLEGLGGVYCENCDIASVVQEGSAERRGVRAWAVDGGLAERLWLTSERMSGIRL